MAFENIRYEERPPIAVVTVDRPKVLNALNFVSMKELEQVFLDIQQNSAVRAVDVEKLVRAHVASLASMCSPTRFSPRLPGERSGPLT